MSTPPRPLDIAITGASGLVGRALVAALTARGHSVRALSRRAASGGDAPRVRSVTYVPDDPRSVAAAIDGADAVVNLAGHGLFDGRWTAARMALIRSSRVDGTKALVDAMRGLARKPSVLVSASAVGFYGPLDPDRTVDEAAGPGDDFLAEVCRAWEAEATKAEALGVRVAVPRLGVVLSRDGGALKQMALPFKLFAGGPVGNGRQVMSWIHRDDLVAMIVAMVEDPRWRGVYNATAPFPASNKAFSKALGRALHRPSFLPTPGLALRVVLGKVASLVTTGQRVLPTAAQALGFTFRFPKAEDALAEIYRA
ncbi:MAG: TIGR01777 family oxidoreductase [Planctomycetota bacterium]